MRYDLSDRTATSTNLWIQAYKHKYVEGNLMTHYIHLAKRHQ